MAKLYVIAKGGGIPDKVLEIARKERIETARVECIGAVSQAEIAFYNHKTKSYEVRKYNEDLEVACIIGNICKMADDLILHIHGTFARRDNSTIAGHVISATADPFLELVITPTENIAYREYDKELNLNVIKRITELT